MCKPQSYNRIYTADSSLMHINFDLPRGFIPGHIHIIDGLQESEHIHGYICTYAIRTFADDSSESKLGEAIAEIYISVESNRCSRSLKKDEKRNICNSAMIQVLYYTGGYCTLLLFTKA
jgi:hypothetical protein